jgi:aspartate racemase
LLDSATKLKQTGAEFMVCPDNTVHQTLDLIRDRLPLPLIHIADVVAGEAQRLGYRTVGLTGTRWLMDGPVYPPKFEERGIAMVLPTVEQRRRIHEIIITELLHGVIRPEALAELQEIVRDLGRRGCDAVALSCTELPLILTPETSPLPVLDSTRLLAMAALDRALDAREDTAATPAR